MMNPPWLRLKVAFAGALLLGIFGVEAHGLKRFHVVYHSGGKYFEVKKKKEEKKKRKQK